MVKVRSSLEIQAIPNYGLPLSFIDPINIAACFICLLKEGMCQLDCSEMPSKLRRRAPPLTWWVRALALNFERCSWNTCGSLVWCVATIAPYYILTGSQIFTRSPCGGGVIFAFSSPLSRVLDNCLKIAWYHSSSRSVYVSYIEIYHNSPDESLFLSKFRRLPSMRNASVTPYSEHQQKQSRCCRKHLTFGILVRTRCTRDGQVIHLCSSIFSISLAHEPLTFIGNVE
jgi:hypothetical protein